MNKAEIIEMAQRYSKNEQEQKAYIAGIQSVCSFVYRKINACYNDEFCDEMQSLSEACFIEFDY